METLDEDPMSMPHAHSEGLFDSPLSPQMMDDNHRRLESPDLRDYPRAEVVVP